jgi:hypothetical protein
VTGVAVVGGVEGFGFGLGSVADDARRAVVGGVTAGFADKCLAEPYALVAATTAINPTAIKPIVSLRRVLNFSRAELMTTPPSERSCAWELSFRPLRRPRLPFVLLA